MTNRSNPVWQMAYAVEFTRQLRDFLLVNPWPSDKHLADMRGDSDTVADAAWCNNAAHRAITPAGFSRAFFEANQ